jgi:hypothetical protein
MRCTQGVLEEVVTCQVGGMSKVEQSQSTNRTLHMEAGYLHTSITHHILRYYIDFYSL